MSQTFSDVLSETEINERVNWIHENLRNVTPEVLYKNLVYMMNLTPFSKMIIGYKIKFLTEDYKQLFFNPITEEFDGNLEIVESERIEIFKTINNLCLALNDHSERCILLDRNFDDYQTTFDEIGTVFDIPSNKNSMNVIFSDGHNIYNITFTQLMYMISFNQNIFTGEPLDDENREHIIQIYTFNKMLMDKVKQKFTTGIKLSYVNSKRLFG